jgi:hypothetical protein
VLDSLYSALPGRRRLPINRRNVWFFTNPDPFDGTLISRELEWSPNVSTFEGWKRSVRWLDEADSPIRDRRG